MQAPCPPRRIAATQCRPSLPAPHVAPRWARWLSALLLLGVLLGLVRIGAGHIHLRSPDFEYFYKSGAWLLHHGALDPGYDLIHGRAVPRGTLDWYWPVVPRLMSILALLPYNAAGYVWLAVNIAALALTVRMLGRRLSGLPPQDWPVTQLIPVLLLMPYWLWEFRLNQINILTLSMLVGSYVCWERGRRLRAGLWLGVAVLLKLTPALFLLWFALKRQYRTVASALLVIVLAGPVADVIAFGPADSVAVYRAWLHRAVTVGSHRGLVLNQLETDWRNQGVGVVLSRWLHPSNYNTHFDNDPRIQADYAHLLPATMNVADLPLRTVANVATVVLAAPLLALCWLARRPASRLTRWQLRFEWALFVLAMLWCMPVVRRYHLIATLPVLTLLASGVHYSGHSSGWSRLALASIGAALLAQLALLSTRVEAAGVLLLSLVVLATPLAVMLVRLGRKPDLLSEPHFTPEHPADTGPGLRAPASAAAPA